MKFYKIGITVLVHFLWLSAHAQYGHEWIDANSSYIRIKTYKNGIYYLTKQTLVNAGMPSNVDPETIRLFHRGKEQQLLISKSVDNSFDAADTLYFYGQRNTGILDSALYKNAVDQPNQFLNLLSDTTVYFLNWSGDNTAKRMSSFFSSAVFSNQPYHLEQLSKYFRNEYSYGTMIGETRASRADIGEGWSSELFSDLYTFKLEGIHDVAAGPDPTLEIQMVGRNSYYQDRKIIVRVGDPSSPVYKDTIKGFNIRQTRTVKITLPASALSGNNLKISFEPLSDNAYDYNYISVNYLRLTYPQAMSANASNYKVYYPIKNGQLHTSQLNWSSADPMVFDISNPDEVNLIPFVYNGSTISLDYAENVDSFLIVSKASLLEPSEIKARQFSLPSLTKNYYIISNSILKSSVQSYADYRSSSEGGSYTIETEWTEDLYDLFSYGEFTPVAIYNFSKFLIANNTNVKFINIIGKGIDPAFQRAEGFYRWEPGAFHNKTDERERFRNLVPSSGSPGSDLLYVMDQNLHPKVAIGRIPAKNNTEVLAYLDKVKEHESGATYRKKIIHMSGGNDIGQSDVFSAFINQYKNIVENSLWHGEVIRSIVKTDFTGFTRVSISSEVNSGLAFITYYGHASEMITDPDFGFASDDTKGFHNKGKYPMLLMVGCEAGNIYSSYSLMEDWLLSPEKGSIAGLGGSVIMYTNPSHSYMVNLYKHLFDKVENLDQPIGTIINKNLNDNALTLDEVTQTQVVLCGDPAVVVNYSNEVTSVKNYEEQMSFFKIHPNPNAGIFTIESQSEGSVEIINSQGAIVYKSTVQNNSVQVQLDIPTGIYFLRMKSGDKQEQKKLVIVE